MSPTVLRGLREIDADLGTGLDVAPELTHRGALLGVDVHPIEGEFPGGRFFQPYEHPAQGRLAAARLTDDAQRLASVQIEGDAVQRLDVADKCGAALQP